MKTNQFAEMLKLEIFEDESAKKGEEKNENYIPRETVLAKLLENNQELIQFINMINPFQDSMKYNHSSYREIESHIRKLFPLSNAITKKLGEAGTKAVLEKWEDGIKLNICNHKEEILENIDLDISDEALAYIFTSPIVYLTKQVIIDKKTAYAASKAIVQISLRAAEATSNLNSEAKLYVKDYFERIIQKEEIDSKDIIRYKNLKYKVLDESVERALETDSYKLSTTILKDISVYLQFIDIPKDRILKECEATFKRLIDQIIEAKKEYDDALVLKNSPEYKDGVNKSVQAIKKQILRTEMIYEELKNKTKKALESVSELHDESSTRVVQWNKN
ncbi:hypothetical protein [Bacillus thuringiensis]|uniref:hypothetical protein n=1 Tax=Bacillus thuringiensis TaxID=1428 RepID=UPI0021D69CE3|nr:hypothetical protein [Bacillus thuringiensis]MCU7667357.1 hypothetical protein [Bacillus thuringiensis]